jgi:hypothetical protein
MRWPSYWLGFATVATAALLLAVAGTASLGIRPPRPTLPDIGQAFPSEYSAAGSDTAHDIFLQGLFGVDAHLRAADLFLLGSSHVEFGLSAGALGALLPKDGRPRRVYNLGLGCGETTGFELEILRRNGISDRPAIAEAGTLLDPGPRQCGQRSDGFDTVQAYVAVLKVWSKYLYDWSVDPVLPRLVFAEGGSHLRRFLFGMVVERDWATGDLVRAWHPYDGAFYPGQPRRETAVDTAAQALGIDWQIGNGQIAVDDSLRRQAASLDIELAVTALPWAGTLPHFNAALHREAMRFRLDTSEATRCFVAIPADALSSWDGGNHLTELSRRLATQRLADGLRETHCLGLVEDATPAKP